MSVTFAYAPGDTAAYNTTVGYLTEAASRAHKRRKSAMDVQSANNQLGTDHSGYSQRVRVNKKLKGKKLSRGQRVLKIVSSTLAPLITRYQNLSRIDDSDGLHFKLNYDLIESGTTTKIAAYPFYLFDLTGLPNRTSASGNVWSLPNVCYRLKRTYPDPAGGTEITNRYYWDFVKAGALADGSASTTATWQIERRPHRLHTAARAHLDWVDIRIGFEGARKYPVNMYYAIVQFNEDLCPGHFAYEAANPSSLTNDPSRMEADPSSTSTEDEARTWNEFYMGLVEKYVSNPLAKRDAYNLKGIKYMDTQKIVFNPTATYENDPRGHRKEVILFKNMNRMCNYQFEKTYGVSISNGTRQGVAPSMEDNPNCWDTANPAPYAESNSEDIQSCVDKPARMFLMIWAESPVNGDFMVDNHGSFEISIRRKHSLLGNW